ncbi:MULTISPECIES: hypothetical protein [unclassified Microcoleus]|uniref:hypothetical protein n=1 Tax=unclassified Microcoleus TaxID=2642155 RepID=UPI002FD76CB4
MGERVFCGGAIEFERNVRSGFWVYVRWDFLALWAIGFFVDLAIGFFVDPAIGF